LRENGVVEVTSADTSDVDSLLALRDGLARWLLDRGIEQWKPGELPRNWIEHQVREGWVHVVRDNEDLVATVTITPEDSGVWGHPAGSSGYVHGLMVDRRWAGQRIGGNLLEWAENQMRESGRDLARLDCVRSNYQLRAYYEALGYKLVGYKDFPDVSWARETALYEKDLF
jgi:GNAT superfamily N-acetyltransferase